jgi:hypothetical protein
VAYYPSHEWRTDLIFMTVILTIAAFCPIGVAISEDGGNVVGVLLGTCVTLSLALRGFPR